MVAHLQLEVEGLQCVQAGPSTPAKKALSVHSKPAAKKALSVQSKPAVFTSIKVPKFSGVTSWDQYRQVFRSNGWEDATVALQLLSHLEGEALNVAMLVPVY